MVRRYIPVFVFAEQQTCISLGPGDHSLSLSNFTNSPRLIVSSRNFGVELGIFCSIVNC